MNRLKHILGVNIPRHVPSTKRSHGTGIDHSVQFRQDGARLVSKGSKTICKRRSKTKSSVMSLKKSSLEGVARGARHYSTRQNVKFNGNRTSKRRALQTMINNANRNSSFIASVEKQRSYAEMIADYSEAIRKASAAAVGNDDFYFSNTIRKSPFSTLTSAPLAKKIINVVGQSGASSKARRKNSPFSDSFSNPLDRSIRYDIAETTNNNYVQFSTTESKSEDRSYVKLVADCSKSAHNASVASNGALTPKLNPLARSSLESFATPTRNASSANNSQEILRKASRAVIETSRQSSTKVSTSTGASKQPQVELHMVPSAKESVVSINVDSVSARLSSPLKLASEELSVVVRSNQKTAAPRATESPWNAATIRQSTSANSTLRHRSDFGPMRISISEDSAPIKQIEFSINGKPVSELKSIVARTERLDVVTSSDKIEIRVPFAKDDASVTSRSRAEDELRRRSDSSVEQVLNVQISANFQNEPTKGSTERSHDATTISTTSTPSPQVPATHSLLRDSAKVSSAIFDNNDVRQRGVFAREDIKVDDTIKRKINERTSSGESRSSKVQRETTRKLSADKSAMEASTIETTNNAEAGKLCARKIVNRRYPEENKYDKNESSDTRVPTNMIPWWSSSDGFNKIRKKENNHKPSNKDELPNASTKIAQSMNNTAAATNNSSDMISHWNSLEQRKELKPTVHYSSLFKPKRKNSDTTSEVIWDDSKVKTMQMPIMEKDSEEISSIKRTQDSSLKQDRGKRNIYPLEETHSIDDAFSTKVKVKGILGDIKPLEKKKDSSLIDYGLKMSSRKSTMKLNGGVKEIRNPSPAVMKTQDLVSKKSITEIAPKTEHINKAGTLKRIQWDKVEKLETKKIILKEKDETIVKNLLTPVDIKAQDENSAKNIKGFKQDKPKSFNGPKMTEIQRSEKLNSLKSSELNDTRHSYNLTGKQVIQQKKPPLTATNTTKSSSQTKPNLTSTIKNHSSLTDSIEKNSGATPFTRRPADKLTETTKNAVIENAKQSSASSDLSKNRQENQSRKSKSALDKRNPAGPTDPPKKSIASAGLKSADSKMHMRTEVKFSESHANFNKRQPSVIGCVSPCIHIDRPEKSVLYSAWLQRFKNDIDSHEKLF